MQVQAEGGLVKRRQEVFERCSGEMEFILLFPIGC